MFGLPTCSVPLMGSLPFLLSDSSSLSSTILVGMSVPILYCWLLLSGVVAVLAIDIEVLERLWTRSGVGGMLDARP